MKLNPPENEQTCPLKSEHFKRKGSSSNFQPSFFLGGLCSFFFGVLGGLLGLILPRGLVPSGFTRQAGYYCDGSMCAKVRESDFGRMWIRY